MRLPRIVVTVAVLAAAIALPGASRAQPSGAMSDAEVRDSITKLYQAGRAARGEESFRRLRQLLDAGRLQDVPPSIVSGAVWAIERGPLEDEFHEFSYDLAASDRFASIDEDVRFYFAHAALHHAAKTADLSRVDPLLGELENPRGFIALLAYREYEPLWPAIERHAGDNLAAVSEGYVRFAHRRLAQNSLDRTRFSELASALYFAGRFEEAVALVQDWRTRRGGIQGLLEGDAWAMNVEAYALDALGRTEEADRIFDQLAGLSPEVRPWVVNFVVNRASRLVGQGRLEEGLAATDLARQVSRKHGSVYARMLVARDRACVLQALGRGSDAMREISYLREHFDQAAEEALTGLLCVGLEAEAEGRIAEALAEADRWGSLADTVQGPRFELFENPSRNPNVGNFILSRAPLRDAALEHVRLIPEQFVPEATLRREEIGNAARAQSASPAGGQ